MNYFWNVIFLLTGIAVGAYGLALLLASLGFFLDGPGFHYFVLPLKH
jgi:hypothetical protein